MLFVLGLMTMPAALASNSTPGRFLHQPEIRRSRPRPVPHHRNHHHLGPGHFRFFFVPGVGHVYCDDPKYQGTASWQEWCDHTD
jgi:hypothetical protein